MKAVGWGALFVGIAGTVVLYSHLSASGSTSSPQAPAAKVIRVRAKPPKVRDLPVKLSYAAEIQPIQSADMKSIEARGFVRAIYVDKGDKVRKGQLLVSVDCPDYRSRKRQAEEEIRNMGALFANARRVYERLQPMRAQNFISQMELDNARGNNDSLEARLRNAEASLAEINETLGYCEMRSPFDGEVAARHKDPGAQVRPGGRPVLTLMRIDVVRVWVNVVERDVSYVRKGLPVELSVYALPGKKFPGKVTRFVRGLDASSRTLLAEIEIENPRRLLKPGMFGRVDLFVAHHPGALLVPQSALLTQECRPEEMQSCTWVYLVQEGRARRVEVKAGYTDGDDVEIVKGIRATDQVVYMGRDLLGDGSAVRLLQ
jgi:RND family efflux transporter MFP subunit